MNTFWCEVYLNKIHHNLNLIKKLTKNKTIIGVVKGNAYGLGIERITEFLDDKIDMFGVTSLDEARKIQSSKPILLLPPLITPKDFESDIPNLIYTLCNEEILDHIDKNKKFTVFIYVDTGMNRMGIKPESLDAFISKIKSDFPNITLDGIYTHLHNTKNKKYTLNQINLFHNIIQKYKNEVSYINCLNSSGVLDSDYIYHSQFCNTVKLGNLLYGYDGFSLGFEKAYTFLAKPVNIHFVKKGDFVGYGCKYKAKRNMYIGMLAVGTIQHLGFYRHTKNGLLYNILKVIYNHFKFKPTIFNEGKGVELLGTPNMNSTLIDLTGCSLDTLFTVNLSPILADSSVPKRYIY